MRSVDEDESGDNSCRSVAVVIDNGTDSIKAGFAGEDAPCSVFPSVVGRPKIKIPALPMKECYVGDEAQSKRGILKMKYPIERGIVTNWDDMEQVWDHTFYNELRVAPEERPVLMTESPFSPKKDKENMTQILFETFSVPALDVKMSAVLSLCSTGRDKGIVVHSGATSSHIVPVYDGNAITKAMLKLELGGRDLDYYMLKLVSEGGYSLCGGCEAIYLANKIKEELCYVALDFDSELKKPESAFKKQFHTPYGLEISFGEQRFQCPEAMFKPSLNIGNGSAGIHQTCFDSMWKSCDPTIHKDMLRTVVLTGGNTLFPGFAERMQKEISSLVPWTSFLTKVIAPPERKYSAWIGGSIIAANPDHKWITAAEYKEYGPSVILSQN